MTEASDRPGHNAVTARAALPKQAAVRIAVRMTAVAIEMSHDATVVLAEAQRRKESDELICGAARLIAGGRQPAEHGEDSMIHPGRSLARPVLDMTAPAVACGHVKGR